MELDKSELLIIWHCLVEEQSDFAELRTKIAKELLNKLNVPTL